MSVVAKAIEVNRGQGFRMRTLRERVEAEFGDFLAWLKSQGVQDPYYLFPPETWHQMLFAITHKRFSDDRKAHAEASSRREAIEAAALALPPDAKSALIEKLRPEPDGA